MSDIIDRLEALADSWCVCKMCGRHEPNCDCPHPDTTQWQDTPESRCFMAAAEAVKQLRGEVERLRAVRLEWDATGLLWLQIDNGPDKTKAGINLDYEQRGPIVQQALREAAAAKEGT